MQSQDQLKGLIMQTIQSHALMRAQANPGNRFFGQYYNVLISQNSLNPTMNEVVSVVYALVSRYLQSNHNNTLQGAQQILQWVMDGDQHYMGQSHFCFWVVNNVNPAEIPPDRINEIQRAANNYYQTGVQLGIYQPQQPQAYHRAPAMGNGFQAGFNANNIAGTGISGNLSITGDNNQMKPQQPTQRVSYRAGGAVSMSSTDIGSKAPPAPVNAPQSPTGAPTGSYDYQVPTGSKEPPKPPQGNLITWANYHATRLSESEVVGPDYASARPYDIMLMEGDGRMRLWVLSHLLDIKPDFDITKPFRKAYSPDRAVRYLVIDEEGTVSEDFLLLKDNEDAMYAALEQGAKPVRRRSNVGDLYAKEVTSDLDPTRVISLDNVEPVDTAPVIPLTPLEQSIRRIEETMNETLTNETIIIADSVTHGEMVADLRSTEASSISYMLCSPYLATAAEMELMNKFQDCATLNDVKQLLDRIGTPHKSVRRIYREITDRLTENINFATWAEFRIRMSAVEKDLGELLAVIQQDFGNQVLAEFIRKTRSVVETSTYTLTGANMNEYTEAYLDGENSIPSGREPLVFCKLMVVNTIGIYSDDINVAVGDEPVRITKEYDQVLGDASKLTTLLTRVIQYAEEKFGYGCSVYIRTVDNHRLYVSRSILQPEQFFLSKFE